MIEKIKKFLGIKVKTTAEAMADIVESLNVKEPPNVLKKIDLGDLRELEMNPDKYKNHCSSIFSAYPAIEYELLGIAREMTEKWSRNDYKDEDKWHFNGGIRAVDYILERFAERKTDHMQDKPRI